MYVEVSFAASAPLPPHAIVQFALRLCGPRFYGGVQLYASQFILKLPKYFLNIMAASMQYGVIVDIDKPQWAIHWAIA